MKQASSAALAILAGGQYLKADLFDFTLQNGLAYHFTSFDVALSAAVYPSSTVNTYLTGLTIARGSLSTKTGVEVQELELTLTPQSDNPAGQVLVGGYSLMQAARLGLFDGAAVVYSKLFMNRPAAGAALDTSPKAVSWFVGQVAEIEPVDRFSLVLRVACGFQYLNIQMPKNLYQAGCTHTVYDTGCTLSKATFTVSGTVGTVTSNSQFNTNLTKADHYFELGVLTFTSGANAGYSATVKSYLNASGALQVVFPFPKTVATGDAFTIYPGCDLLQSTCTSKFSNLAHFKATPYVPVPETLYDGGTSNPANPSAPLTQTGGLVSSQVSGRLIQKQ